MTDWSKLKVPELKAELKSRGLPQNGLKAALVARLDDEAVQTTHADVDASIESNTVDNSPRDEEAAALSQPQAEANGAPKPSVEAAPQDKITDDLRTAPETEQAVPAQTEILPVSQEQNKDDDVAFDLPPVDIQQFSQDIESRKRRSLTPPPADSDAPRKRQRQEAELPATDVEGKQDEIMTSQGDAQWEKGHNNVGSTVINVESEKIPKDGGAEEGATDVDDVRNEVVPDQVAPGHGEHPVETRDDSADTNMEDRLKDRPSTVGDPIEDHETRHRERNTRSPSPPFNRLSEDPRVGRDYDMPDAEQERSVAPAIHPATSALYIRNFQRPLNRTELKDYITTLATAPGQSPDPDVICDFFLDSICTHAFISFTNTSAASRVRSELHDRIWPDERTRQPLWTDFIPYDRVGEWIETEIASSAARSGKKWEVIYDMDEDRNVTASLHETGAVPAQLRKQSSSNMPPTPTFGRLGVAGAPSGPKADIRRRDDGLRFDDQRNVETGHEYGSFDRPHDGYPPVAPDDADMIFTKSSPPVSFIPVAKSLAERRLDNIHTLYARDAESDFRAKSEAHRYTFEGETLVDRGPEIFPGIRPPPGVRRRGLPRGLLARGGRAPRPSGPRGYGRDDGRNYRDYRDERPGDFRNGPPRGGRGRDSYGGGGFDRGDRYERPYDRPKDDFGSGSNYRGNYREGAHWRGGAGGMGRRY